MSGVERRYLSPAQVAQALGVSESTVKRWVDENKLRAQRTAGGHRRILAADVIHMVQQENWPHIDLDRLTTGVLGDADDGGNKPVVAADPILTRSLLRGAVLSGDAEEARAIVLRAHKVGLSVATLADEVFAPVMTQVGHDWATGHIDVYQEHRATQLCLSAVLALKARLEASSPPGPDRPLAIGGGPESDHYLLANLLIETTLRDLGWRVVNIGPNTPFASFCRAVQDMRPRLLWLSCSYVADTEKFLTGYQDLQQLASRHNVLICIGGRALTEEMRQRMSYDHYGDRLSQLATFARQIAAKAQA